MSPNRFAAFRPFPLFYKGPFGYEVPSFPVDMT